MDLPFIRLVQNCRCDITSDSRDLSTVPCLHCRGEFARRRDRVFACHPVFKSSLMHLESERTAARMAD